jgi:pseudouridine-5'-phosphate glycosidase
MRADTPGEVAALLAAKWRLGLSGGVAVVNPIPASEEIPRTEIDAVIERALADMADAGVHGSQATPFLLARIVELTGGASLAANIALVKNNARLGAQVAAELARMH